MRSNAKLLSIFPGLGRQPQPVSVAGYLKSRGLIKPEAWDKFALECDIPRQVMRKIMQEEITDISDETLLQMSFHSGMNFHTLKNINDAWKLHKQRRYHK